LKRPPRALVHKLLYVTPDPLSPTPTTSSAVRLQQTQKRALMTLNQQMKEISIGYSSD